MPLVFFLGHTRFKMNVFIFFGGGGQKRIFYHLWSRTKGSLWRTAWKVLSWTQTRKKRTSTTYMTLGKNGTVLPLYACLTGQSVSIWARKRGIYHPKMDEQAALNKLHSNSTRMSGFSCPSSFVVVPYMCWSCGLLRLLTLTFFQNENCWSFIITVLLISWPQWITGDDYYYSDVSMSSNGHFVLDAYVHEFAIPSLLYAAFFMFLKTIHNLCLYHSDSCWTTECHWVPMVKNTSFFCSLWKTGYLCTAGSR